jgi:aminotransferase
MRENLAARARNIQQSKIRAVTRKIEAIGGVNLGQGTCELVPNPEVLRAAQLAISEGHNSYTLFDGIPALREAIADRYRCYNGLEVDSDNILVTSGATGALECVCKCFLDEGDEVVLFEPIYQYHVKLVLERGAIPRFVRLHAPDWTIDVDELAKIFTNRTKLFVFANPNNPSGKVFSYDELRLIGDCCRSHGVVAVVDEVYEYILSEGQRHISLASLPEMFDHTLTLSSASKTLFVTGWRVGWLVGPADILGPLGVKSDETYVCAPAPFQHAVAHGLRLGDEFFGGIKKQFHPRQKKLASALTRAGFKPSSPEGAYYILADYRELGFKNDADAMEKLIERVGVGAVPGQSFFPSGMNTGLLRFCFAVTEEVLNRGCELLTSGRLGEA